LLHERLNRRQALIVGGLGALSLGMPGVVMGSDKLDASGNAVAAEKSCIFVLLCGGPSHVDTWDMKPDAPDTIAGPYQPIATKVPGMRINEMHTRAGEVDRPVHADQFDDASGRHQQSLRRDAQPAQRPVGEARAAGRARRPALPRLVRRQAQAEQRNIVSNAWLIKCVGPPVFCAPNIGIGGYLGSAYAPVFVGSAENHPAMDDFKPPEIYDLGDQTRLRPPRKLLSKHRERRAGQGSRARTGRTCARRATTR
jgi:hypothetical protein